MCVGVPNNARGGTVPANRRGSLIRFPRNPLPRAQSADGASTPNNGRGACPGFDPPEVALGPLDLIPRALVNYWAASATSGAGGADGLLSYDVAYHGGVIGGGVARPIFDGVNVNFGFYWNGASGYETGTLKATVPGNPLGLSPFATFVGSAIGHWTKLSIVWPMIDGRPVRWLTCKLTDTAESSGGPWAYFRRTGGWPAEGDYEYVPPTLAPHEFRFRPFWGDESGCVDSPW